MKPSLQRPPGGFTLIELLVASMMVAITGWLVFLFLNTGTVLFAKNTAMNLSHQQARVAIVQMQQDVHAAVSIPQLVDASLAAVAGTGPAAGLAFQLPVGKNLQVNADAAATDKQINVRVPSGYTVPLVGQRLIVPTHSIEQDITSVAALGGGIYRCGFANALGADIDVINGGASYNVVCFLTKRVAYAVVSGELRFYPVATASTYQVMASNITKTNPFQIPLAGSGSPSNRFIAAVDLSTTDSTSNRRGYKAANMFLSTQIPYRARLTTYQ